MRVFILSPRYVGTTAENHKITVVLHIDLAFVHEGKAKRIFCLTFEPCGGACHPVLENWFWAGLACSFRTQNAKKKKLPNSPFLSWF